MTSTAPLDKEPVVRSSTPLRMEPSSIMLFRSSRNRTWPEHDSSNESDVDEEIWLRECDLWMIYIVRTLLGKRPRSYPTVQGLTLTTALMQASLPPNDPVEEDPDVSDSCSDLDRNAVSEETPLAYTLHDQLAQAHIPIDSLVYEYVTDETARDPEIIMTLLRLCDEERSRRSYNFVVNADHVMVETNGVDGLRIVENVCKEIMNTFSVLTEAQNKASERLRILKHRLWRISLRRVFLRLCGDTAYLPRFLLVEDMGINALSLPDNGGTNWDVYRIDSPTHGCVAVKRYREITLSRPMRHGDIRYHQFVFTACLQRFLEHPHVLPLLGVYQQPFPVGSSICFVHPWMVHADVAYCMAQLGKQNRPIPRRLWIVQIASALNYLHDECVVHGSIHSGNILVDEHLDIRIADFAQPACDTRPESPQLSLGWARGSLWWTAPEISLGDMNPTYPGDVWSFGCICHMIWSGRGPFHYCKSPYKVYAALNAQNRLPEGSEPLDNVRKDQPQEVATGKFLRQDVVLKCWERDPKNRPTMAQLLSTLTDGLEVYEGY